MIQTTDRVFFFSYELFIKVVYVSYVCVCLLFLNCLIESLFGYM